MPATVTLDRERGIRITTAVGPVRWVEFLEIYHKIAGDPCLAAATRTLVDLQHASLDGLTRADVKAAVNLPKLPNEEDTRLAIVAKSPVVYGVSRMYALMQDLRGRGEIQVFTRLDEAMRWLVE
jgi:hypothetical protein